MSDDMAVDYEEAVEDEKSTGGGRARDAAGRSVKGRGVEDDEGRYAGTSGKFDRLVSSEGGQGDSAPAPSVEGWIVFASGVHDEAQEEDLHDLFAEYGEIKNLHLNLDRRTGFVKGYVLVEYEAFEEAKAAIEALDGTKLLDQQLKVDWAFRKGPIGYVSILYSSDFASGKKNRL